MDIKQDQVSADELKRSLAAAGPFVAMVDTTRTPMVVTNPRLTDNPIVYANAAFIAMSG